MSRHRATPGRGYVIAALLPKGPSGLTLCRYCKGEVQPPRRTFCNDACIHEWRVRSDPSYAKLQVWIRDRGKCQACHQTPFGIYSTAPDRRTARRHGGLWAMDHVIAVEEGGGECGLENLQTLCLPCHRAKTTQHARRRAEAKRAAKLPHAQPGKPRLTRRRRQD